MEKTFAKGLMLLETLVAMEEPGSVTRLANMLGLQKSNVHRLLRTLVASGYVVQIGDGRYMPSLRLTEMGEAVWASIDVAALVAPALTAIAGTTGHPAVLMSAERGGLRIRAASGAGISGSLPMQGAARVLADLLRRESGAGRTLVLPLEGAGPRASHLCLAPVPDLRLPVPLGLALVAADDAQARALSATVCDMADRLAQTLSGSGPVISGRTPVSA